MVPGPGLGRLPRLARDLLRRIPESRGASGTYRSNAAPIASQTVVAHTVAFPHVFFPALVVDDGCETRAGTVLIITFIAFHVPVRDEKAGVFIPIALASDAMGLAIGLFLVGIVRSFKTLTALARFMLLALLLVQGIFVKLAVWPHPLRIVARWSPADVSLRLLYATLSRNRWTTTQWHLLMAEAIYIAVLGGLGGVLFRNVSPSR